MTKQIIGVSIFSLLFIGWHCGNDDNPVDFRDNYKLLSYSSFEIDGLFNLNGWNLSDSNAQHFVSISSDVPTTYNFYSVKLHRDTITPYWPSISKQLINWQSDSLHKYVISFWGNGKGELLIEQKRNMTGVTVVNGINSKGWKHFNVSAFHCQSISDTIAVTFRPYSNDSIIYLLLDNVEISVQKR